MTMEGIAEVQTVESKAMGTDKDGKALPQKISRGPVAAIIPIKHLGTNGGGFFGANSAHPFENPTALSNFLTCVNIMIFPFSLVIMFGRHARQHAARRCDLRRDDDHVPWRSIGWAIYWDTLHPNPADWHRPDRSSTEPRTRRCDSETRGPAG